jgi:cell division protein FtsB
VVLVDIKNNYSLAPFFELIQHVNMDEQQVKALLKRMAKLEAENASLKQQIDKKSEDKDLIDLTEPDA